MIGAVEMLSHDRVLFGEEAKIAWFLISHDDRVEQTSEDVADGLLDTAPAVIDWSAFRVDPLDWPSGRQ